MFWVLGSCRATHTQRYYKPVENFRVYLQAKNQLHPPFVSGDIAKICKLSLLDTLGIPHFPIPKCILDFFQEKLMTKCFKKPYFGDILGSFCPNSGKTEFFWKERLCQFLNIPIIYHRAKNQNKLISHSWEKCWTDGQTDRRTDNGDFIGPSLGRGSDNNFTIVWRYLAPCYLWRIQLTFNHFDKPVGKYLATKWFTGNLIWIQTQFEQKSFYQAISHTS